MTLNVLHFDNFAHKEVVEAYLNRIFEKKHLVSRYDIIILVFESRVITTSICSHLYNILVCVERVHNW